MSIRSNIQQAMQDKNIRTIKELAQITGVSQGRLYKILKQENANITQITADKLNSTLNLKLKIITKNNNLIRGAMRKGGIQTIKELSILTGLSQNNLYKLTQNNGLPIKPKTAKMLNKALNLNLIGIERKNDNSIGYKIFKLRQERNISAEKLSVLANMSIATISALERNKNKPSDPTIKKLAKAFKVNESKLRKMLFEN